MIPAWLTWRVALYGAAGAVLLGILAWAGLTVGDWRSEAQRVPVIEAERDQAVANATQLKLDITTIQEVSDGYQKQLAANAAEDARRRAQPARVVRLCINPARAGVSLSAAGIGLDAAATATGELQPTAGPDIGRGLKGITDDADRREADLAAQIRGLQEYARRKAGTGAGNGAATAAAIGALGVGKSLTGPAAGVATTVPPTP